MKRIYLSYFLFITFTLLIIDLAVSPMADRIVSHYFKNEINRYYGDLVRGTFYMLAEDLHKISVDRWDTHIDSLQTHFGYPIDLVLRNEIDLTPEEDRDFQQKRIIVTNDQELFYQRVGETEYLLSMGPFDEDNVNLYPLYVIIWGMVILFLALFTSVWALPFERKLRNISSSAIAFGEGNLEARAVIPKRSSLAPLADSFNSMADHIQQLINNQRELTNAVSHELRTPIARVRFGLEMLGDAKKEADRKHYISELTQDVDELDNLITESLTYARFDSGNPQIDLQSCIITKWLEPIIEKVAKAYPSISCRINNQLSPVEKEGLLEIRYMTRAVTNLIQNGMKHTKTSIEVTLAQEESNIFIHIDDNGDGIAEADRLRIFDPFTRLDTSRNRATGGYGLGLAIVKRIANWHGGNVVVTDSPYGGARFTLEWPAFAKEKVASPDSL